jgi:hypothetical protein
MAVFLLQQPAMFLNPIIHIDFSTLFSAAEIGVLTLICFFKSKKEDALL